MTLLASGDLFAGLLTLAAFYAEWLHAEGIEDACGRELGLEVSAAMKTRDRARLVATVRRYFAYVNARFGGLTPGDALAEADRELATSPLTVVISADA